MVHFVVDSGVVYVNPQLVIAVYQPEGHTFTSIVLATELTYQVRMSAPEVVSMLRGGR